MPIVDWVVRTGLGKDHLMLNFLEMLAVLKGLLMFLNKILFLCFKG